MFERAAMAEMELDHAGWDGLTTDEAIDRAAEVDDLYRSAFRAAQRVSASFYEQCARTYGWTTPLVREVLGLDREHGKDIEDLMGEPVEELGF